MLAEMKTRRAAPAVRGPPPPSPALPDARSAAAGGHCAVRVPEWGWGAAQRDVCALRAPSPGQLPSFPTWLTSPVFPLLFERGRGGGGEGTRIQTSPGHPRFPFSDPSASPRAPPPRPSPPSPAVRAARGQLSPLGSARSAGAARSRLGSLSAAGLGEPEAGRSGGDGRREREIYEAGSASQKLPCQSK